jgi:hypothetical protein
MMQTIVMTKMQDKIGIMILYNVQRQRQVVGKHVKMFRASKCDAETDADVEKDINCLVVLDYVCRVHNQNEMKNNASRGSYSRHFRILVEYCTCSLAKVVCR